MEGVSEDDAFNTEVFNHAIRITVTNPQKVGNFISSYVTYRINSIANLNQPSNHNISVTRRFNDFILLYQKLQYKYAHVGRIIPPPPEKDFGGMMSVKISNEADVSRMEFVERRRAALERFLYRLASHIILREDVFFKLFLTSKTNYKKTVQNIQNRVNENGFLHGLGNGLYLSVMDNDDTWFERKPDHLESYQEMLKVFSEALHDFHLKKKNIGETTGYIARRVRMVSSYEENQQFSVLLYKIAEGHKDLEKIYVNQSEKESALLTEIIRDYIKFTIQAKSVFDTRAKAYRNVQHVEKELEIRRQKETAYLHANRNNFIANKFKRLREQTEERLERYIQIYLEISKTVKEEVSHFERLRTIELKEGIRHWICNSTDTQQQIINIYKDYLKLDECATYLYTV